MAFCQNSVSLRKIGVLVTTLLLVLSGTRSGFALPDSDEPPVSALSIASQIEDLSLVEVNSDQALSKPETVEEARKQILEALPSGNRERFEKAVSFYRELADAYDSERDQNVVEVFEHFSKIYDFQDLGANYDELVKVLGFYSNKSDWLVSFHAKRLLSFVHTLSYKNGLALRTAQEAIDIIPNDLSPEATESRIFALELLAYLQNITWNKDLALYNTQRLIDLKLETGQPIDGIELINNLMFSLTEWRDYETRLELAKTLKRLEIKFGSTTPGLSSTHIARVNNDTGNYEDAKIAALESLDEAKIDSIKRIASIQLATAYAGLGETQKAKSLLDSMENQLNSNDATVSYANALIALKEGNLEKALSLLNQKYDRKVTQILKATNRDTMEMLAELENSSERQAEREAALQREAALIQTKLDQQQRINKLLIAFMLLIGLTGICALLFARHRDKLAKLLAIKSREAESADRMKTEFLGMVSHELRTPLNGIIGLADVLATSGPTEEVRQRGDIILTSGNILFSLIENIIDMSRLEAGKLELAPEPTDLKALIERDLACMERRSAEKGIIFTSYIAPECGQTFDLDPERVGKCVNTLLCNALKFTTEGRIHLHVTEEADRKTGQSEITVIVADTGQGISEEVQAKLFTPFLQADTSMTRKHGGSGLRLAISRMLARMMDGDITLKSKEGRGSEFTLTFKAKPSAQLEIPVMETDFEAAEVTPPATPPMKPAGPTFLLEPTLAADNTEAEGPRQSRALIVEDLSSNQDVIAVMLDAAGIQYVPVESGEKALNVLQTQRFDFVLMDIHMPGMDGIETTRRIRAGGQTWSDIPIIALTADAASENQSACIAAGIDMFLTKPVRSKDLMAAIETVTQQSFKPEEAKPRLLSKRA
ncbi:response regulator [Litorimonas haliclonae]|uniref:response regulator n=1 Tax=Litorimonas haliclonae TaxID=2081977 RepID=UPI0039F081F4